MSEIQTELSDESSQRNIEDIYPLSPLQQGMLFHSIYSPESGVYFEQSGWTLHGEVDARILKMAWQKVIERHPALRTAFVWDDLEEPLQVVYKRLQVPLEEYDWRDFPEPEQQQMMETFLQKDRQRGFELSTAPLMRLSLVQLADDCFNFTWSHHHLLLDGWSQPIILQEFFIFYEAIRTGKEIHRKYSSALPPSRPYRDYIAWLKHQDIAEAENFWRRTLHGFSDPTPLVVDAPSLRVGKNRHRQTDVPIRDGLEGDYIHLKALVSEKVSASLHSLVQAHQLTLNTVIQGAWALLLSRYSSEEDVLFGATVSGRPVDLPGSESIVGMFINTLPVRVQVNPQATVISWLKKLQSNQVELRQYEYSPLVEIQKWSEIPPSLPLFESLLVFENYPVSEVISRSPGSGDAHSSSLDIQGSTSFTRTNFPITVAVSPGKVIGIEIAYDANRFDEQVIERMVGHFQTILESIASILATNPDQPCGNIALLTAGEWDQILVSWNSNLQEFSKDRCIHHLFEEQVEATPESVAVIFGDTQVTYAELNRRANQLAHRLQKMGVQPNTDTSDVAVGYGPDVPAVPSGTIRLIQTNQPLVGICVERSLEMIVALLGVLKAGGAYLPLDPKYPPERLAFMLEDSHTWLLLTQSHLLERLPAYTCQTLVLDKDWEAIECEDSSNFRSSKTAQYRMYSSALAYVIYTSGSTGLPKGVMVTHQSLVNHALNMARIFSLNQEDRVLQFISLSFDAAGEEIFPTLVSGAAVVLPETSIELVGGSIIQFCEEKRVSFLHLPAAFWHQCVDDMVLSHMPVPATVRLLLVGGESPSLEKLQAWSKLADHPVRFLNGYGPTEATITTTCFATDCRVESFARLVSVPIGRPIANTQVYVLDRQHQPVPVGVPGELCIGGAGLARGYLNRPDLTAERFIPMPNWHRPNQFKSISNNESFRLYRTGDMVRYLPDGNLEFVGRVDYQVKLRGFRIELGEIEATLNQFPGVREGVVVVREDSPGDKRVVAYLVPSSAVPSGPLVDGMDYPVNKPNISLQDLRNFMKSRLPEYMIPSAFVVLEALPITPGGKVDRRSLPVPGVERGGLGPACMPDVLIRPPRTPIEASLVEIWQQVLGVKQVGIQDSFFELGGHSLLAMQLISRVQSIFQVQIPLRQLFEKPTLVCFAEQVEAALRGIPGIQAPPILPVSRDADLPLSFSQQRLWILDQLDPGNLFNNIPTAVRLQGNLDIIALEHALNEIIRRHEALRTHFAMVAGKPVQVVLPHLKLPLATEDISTLPTDQKEAEAIRLAFIEARQPFDLARGPLLRARLLRLNEQDHVALLTMHHIVSDGWSMGLLVQELATLYAAFSKNQLSTGNFLAPPSDLLAPPSDLLAPLLPELAIQYPDYAVWQRNWLQGEVLESQLDFWKEKLKNSPPMLELPTDHPRPALQSSNGASYSFSLPGDISESLKELGREEQATFFMTLLAAFKVMLFRYSGQEDICVGTPVANRSQSEIQNLIGFFINTLVLRTDLSGDPSFRELLSRVRETALGAYAHQELPFEILVESLQPERNLSHTPLFQVMFVLNNFKVGTFTLPGLKLSSMQTHSGAATFDLTLSLDDNLEGLSGYIEYNTDLFEKEAIEDMVAHLQVLLEGIIADPDKPISRLPLLTEDEKKLLLVDWNISSEPTPTNHCVHELFEMQVQQCPEAPAVIFALPSSTGHGVGIKQLTYAELNARANQLARFLQKLGVQPDVLVGISTQRSLEMIIGILGILKAGGAYLPLDPNYPPDRLAFMLEDSQVKVLLTQSHLVEHIPAHSARTVQLETDWAEIELENAENLSSGAKPENLAYVIYTSGSTGKPKGTMLRHNGLCNLSAAQKKAFNIHGDSRILQFSPFSFDASVWETFMALANGAVLCLTNQEVLASGPALVQLLSEQSITNITLPPSVLRVLPPEELPALQTVIAAGEACTPDLVERWAPGRDFFNAYGPTETTVCASMYHCNSEDKNPPPQYSAAPIGRPIANTRLYILDKNMQLVPVGVPGELHVSGVSLARGYLNRPEMTSLRFVPNPFGPDADGTNFRRLYKTGDLVRYRRNGNIEFLGRVDTQVKVRGFRIELGEIETALGAHPGVREAVVLARVVGANGVRPEDLRGEAATSDLRLVAYLVPQAEPPPESAELRSFLRQTLPEYMIPSTFIFMDAFPLSPSGKVDRRALPAPEGARAMMEHEYVAPRNPDEEKLAALCAELLGLDKVGVYDNFFELGGHSLLATQFISRVREVFAMEMPLRALFEHPNVAEFAEILERMKESSTQPQAPATDVPIRIVAVSRDARRMKRSDLRRS